MCPLDKSLSSISNPESFPIYPCHSTLNSHIYIHIFLLFSKKAQLPLKSPRPFSGRGGSAGTGARLTRRGSGGHRVARLQVPGSPRMSLEVARSPGHPCRVARPPRWTYKRPAAGGVSNPNSISSTPDRRCRPLFHPRRFRGLFAGVARPMED
jgi:hypothetical protein